MLWILYVGQHVLYSGIISRLNYHHGCVLYTSMSLVMIFQINSIVPWPILFQTLCHIKGLLTIYSDSSWSIWLNVRHIEASAIWWLTTLIVIHPHSTYLCRVMHLFYRHGTWLSIALDRLNETNIKIILDVITGNRVSCRAHTLDVLLGLAAYWICSLSVNSLNLFNFLRWLRGTEFYLSSISGFRGSLRTDSIEKSTTNHGCLVHNEFWLLITRSNPIQAITLLWWSEIYTRLMTWILQKALLFFIMGMLKNKVTSCLSLKLLKN